ncbi:chaplin [Streptomyces sp. NPDC008313]|uniref:chaplin n=1 Tax=Streptomyces sp. NPDC008313 TaxID=3364826 RepID=UPI0036EA19DB
MVVAAAATSILSLYGNPAFADSHANGNASDSPGVLSGNNVQVPVHVPVNACGNSVNLIGALNPAFGNACVNGSGGHEGKESDEGSQDAKGAQDAKGSRAAHGSDDSAASSDDADRSGDGHAGSSAYGETHGSPGVGSGNAVQVPVDIPVNACGNTIDVVGLLNRTSDNECVNGPSEEEAPPEKHVTPPVEHKTPPTRHTPPAEHTTPQALPPTLAHTGGDGVLGASAAGAALLVGGAVLYRRSRAAARR